MSLLRTLIILLLIYFVFRYILRGFFGAASKKSLPHQGPGGEGMREQLYPCPTCGTYNAAAAAFQANGGYYCSQECFNKRERQS